MYPESYKYTKDHEWVRIDGAIATIGITDHAQEELGDVVFVELPEAEVEVSAGEPMGTIESVKAVADLYAPISGTVTDVNGALEDEPELVNSDPHEAGWMVKVEMSDQAELDELMDAEQYAQFLEESGN